MRTAGVEGADGHYPAGHHYLTCYEDKVIYVKHLVCSLTHSRISTNRSYFLILGVFNAVVYPCHSSLREPVKYSLDA